MSYNLACVGYRLISKVDSDEAEESERFLQECITDPSLRDKLSILNRTFATKKQVLNAPTSSFTIRYALNIRDGLVFTHYSTLFYCCSLVTR
jgi:hypothetical protein